MNPIRPLHPQRKPIDGVCVDCGNEVLAADVARVLRVDSQGRGRVVCNACSERIHAARHPTPLQVQRPPRRPTSDEPS